MVKTKLLKEIQTIFTKTISVVVVLYLLLFYFKLGWYIAFLWVIGGIVTILITKSEWRNSGYKSFAFVLLVYILLIGGFTKILLDQHSYKTFVMNWTDKGVDNRHKTPEVVFQFQDYPTESLGIFSNDVSRTIHQIPGKKVSVTFEITSDFGCVRGFNEIQIGDLKQWKSTDGYYSSNSSNARKSNPFGSNWWCF